MNGGDYNDSFNEFIVCCEDETKARQTHPGETWTYDGSTKEWFQIHKDGSRHTDRYITKNGKIRGATWIDASKISELKVTRVGTALPGMKYSVLLASFNAG